MIRIGIHMYQGSRNMILVSTFFYIAHFIIHISQILTRVSQYQKHHASLLTLASVVAKVFVIASFALIYLGLFCQGLS